MAFKTRPPGQGQNPLKPGRSKPLQSKEPMKPGSGFVAKAPLSAGDRRKAQQKALQKATLCALEKAQKEAAERGVDLSEWENAFLDGVSARIKTYGRAFADPDKGATGTTLSVRQGVKLKEIRKKATTAKPKS